MLQIKQRLPAVAAVLSLLSLFGCGSRQLGSTTPTIRAGSSGHLFDVTVGGKHGFIDSSGKLAINPQFDDDRVDWFSDDPFEQGLLAVCVGPCGKTTNVPNGKWGYIDRKGTVVINFQFDAADPFSEGLAAVCLGDCRNGGDSKWGYVDQKGAYAINPQFGEAWNFKEGLAAVCVGNYKDWKCDGKEGFVDRSGHFVINPQFDDASSFHNGLALITVGVLSERKNGYIDKTGKILWDPSN